LFLAVKFSPLTSRFNPENPVNPVKQTLPN